MSGTLDNGRLVGAVNGNAQALANTAALNACSKSTRDAGASIGMLSPRGALVESVGKTADSMHELGLIHDEQYKTLRQIESSLKVIYGGYLVYQGIAAARKALTAKEAAVSTALTAEATLEGPTGWARIGIAAGATAAVAGALGAGYYAGRSGTFSGRGGDIMSSIGRRRNADVVRQAGRA